MELLPHEKQIQEYIKTIERLKKQNLDQELFCSEIEKLEKKLDQLKEQVYSQLTPWERVQICRHPARPKTVDYIEHLCEEFQELSGDRLYREDPSIIGGLAKIGGMECMLIGQEKGKDTETRVHRNFGMMSPEGYRKALRLMQMADKFGLPIVNFIDTPGAFPGLEAEKLGQGWAIAQNLRDMSLLRVPILVVIIGEGCSGGALGIGVGDVIAMLEHAYYSVISPEGCASILWKDASKNKEAAATLRLNAENLYEFDVIDDIIKEPMGGAHHDPHAIYQSVKHWILEKIPQLQSLSSEELVEQRYDRFRKLGQFVTEQPSDPSVQG